MSGNDPNPADAVEPEMTVDVAGRSLPARRVFGALLALLLLTVPFTFGTYYMNLLTRALLFAIFALSLDILWGYGGVLTFGHAAIFGLGAYSMARVLIDLGFAGAGYVGIVVGTALGGIAGLVIAGALFYRNLGENTFVIITLAIAAIAQQIAITWESVTGGYNGLMGIPQLEVGIPAVAMVAVNDFAFYYLALVLVYLSYRFGRRLINSPFGTAMQAIRENEAKARALGYNIPKYKTIAFGISSAMAGFAGAMHTAQINFIAPNLVGFILSTNVILWVLVGGRGTLVGAIVGTVFLVLFENIISGVVQFGWTLLLGIVLVVIVLGFPGGLMQLFGIVRERLFGDGTPMDAGT